jgi:hypothetical protein
LISSRRVGIRGGGPATAIIDDWIVIQTNGATPSNVSLSEVAVSAIGPADHRVFVGSNMIVTNESNIHAGPKDPMYTEQVM